MKDSIIFEVIPPSKTASEAYAKKIADKISDTLSQMKDISALNIPEIAEENHIGLPYYKNIDNREFGLLLKQRCNKEVIINTVSAYYNPKESFEHWLDESISKYNLKNFVFVGQKINSIKYPGPSIVEANSIAKSKKANFGNICIPDRENEAERLVSKTASGCSFFTSQVLFESERIVDVLKEYSIKCENANLKPAKFFLSFSPVSDFHDISFIKWLGTEISEKKERRLKFAQNTGEESIKVIVEVLDKIFNYFYKTDIKIPLGLNIEYITLHNLELSKNLVNSISDLKFNFSIKIF